MGKITGNYKEGIENKRNSKFFSVSIETSS